MSDDGGPRGLRKWIAWFRRTEIGPFVWIREVATSVGAVLAVGLLLFAISGVWPPMVAIESSSMNPHMKTGDLVFVMDEQRLSPEFAHAETGVVTYETGLEQGYTKFQEPGDVIIYRPDNRTGTPIIHRARFWVSDGENWYDRANQSHIGDASNCQELQNCPAPHAGFITKGDNEQTNQKYDQVNGLSDPVKPAWIVGTAEMRIPVLGFVKLCASAGPCPLTVTAPYGDTLQRAGDPALPGGPGAEPAGVHAPVSDPAPPRDSVGAPAGRRNRTVAAARAGNERPQQTGFGLTPMDSNRSVYSP